MAQYGSDKVPDWLYYTQRGQEKTERKCDFLIPNIAEGKEEPF